MDFYDLKDLAIVFLVGLIALSFIAYTTQEIAEQEADISTYTDGTDAWNPATNTTTFSLTKASVGDYSSLVARNLSNVVVASGNYTFDASAGTIILTAAGGASEYNGTQLNLTYSYGVYTGNMYNIMSNGTGAYDKIGKNMPTLGLILGAGLIIGSLYFMYRNKFKA